MPDTRPIVDIPNLPVANRIQKIEVAISDMVGSTRRILKSDRSLATQLTDFLDRVRVDLTDIRVDLEEEKLLTKETPAQRTERLAAATRLKMKQEQENFGAESTVATLASGEIDAVDVDISKDQESLNLAMLRLAGGGRHGPAIIRAHGRPEELCSCDRPDESDNPHRHTRDAACRFWVWLRDERRFKKLDQQTY